MPVSFETTVDILNREANRCELRDTDAESADGAVLDDDGRAAIDADAHTRAAARDRVSVEIERHVAADDEAVTATAAQIVESGSCSL